MRSVDVLMRLVHDDLHLPDGYSLEFIGHHVGRNWRQRYRTAREQIGAVPQALVHSGPFDGWRVRVGELAGALHGLAETRPSVATSVTSRVWNEVGCHVGHLALMNLHPMGFDDVSEVREAVRLVVDGRSGYLLSSGRHFHYYGRWLLSVPNWTRFLSQFLMPCVMVSPRYIGHSLYRGFCSLRLNAAPPTKPVVPLLVDSDGTQ